MQRHKEVNWSRLEELKFLVHFMGDIHQPLQQRTITTEAATTTR
jgi:hypothetical protein